MVFGPLGFGSLRIFGIRTTAGVDEFVSIENISEGKVPQMIQQGANEVKDEKPCRCSEHTRINATQHLRGTLADSCESNVLLRYSDMQPD